MGIFIGLSVSAFAVVNVGVRQDGIIMEDEVSESPQTNW